MGGSNPSQRVAWLLREGASETIVPAGERTVVDDDYWRATIERFDLSSGIRLYLTQAQIRKAFTLEPRQHVEEPWLLAHMAVKGRVTIGLSDGFACEIGPDRSVLFRPADHKATFSPFVGQSVRLVGYMIRADRVRSIFGEALPDMLKPLIADTVETGHLISIPTNARIRRMASSLFTSELRGSLRVIFMDGVVMQLLATQTSEAASRTPASKLSSEKRARLRQARDQLIDNIGHPPSLSELAADAGMSEEALNDGFRTLFGGSVYAVLRDQRLEHALVALKTTDIPLKQIAHGVGYNHVTNFINAFTRRYGEPPGRVRRRLPEE